MTWPFMGFANPRGTGFCSGYGAPIFQGALAGGLIVVNDHRANRWENSVFEGHTEALGHVENPS